MPPAYSLSMRSNAVAMKAGFEQLETSEFYRALHPRLRGAVYLVLDELISNTIKFGGSPIATIRIRMEKTGDQLVLQLQDNASPFNPLNAPPPVDHEDLQEIPIGGRGIHMVKQVVDHLEYHFLNGHNVVTLTFNQPTPPEPVT